MGPRLPLDGMVGDYLRRTRELLDWRLDDVAHRVAELGVSLSRTSLSRIERGITSPSLREVAALCRVMGIPPSTLWEQVRFDPVVPVPDLPPRELMRAALDALTLGQNERALRLSEGGLERLLASDERNDVELLAELLVQQSDFAYRCRLLSLAATTATRVINLPRCPPRRKAQGVVLHAVVAVALEDYFLALRYGEYLEPRLDQLNASDRAYAISNIGIVHYRLENWERAIPPLRESVHLYRSVDQLLQATRNAITLGFCIARSGRQAEGRAIMEQTTAECLQHEFYDNAVWGYEQLGDFEDSIGAWDAARDAYNAGIALARRTANITDLFALTLYRWKLERKLRQSAQADGSKAQLVKLLGRANPRCPAMKEFIETLHREDPRAVETQALRICK